MKKYFVLASALIIIVLFFVFSSSSKKVGDSSTSSDTSSTTESMNKDGNDSMVATEKYVAFKDGVVEEQSDKKRALFFYANWCPTCRPVDAELKASESKIPDGAVVIRVNYNDSETDAAEKELADKYGITYQHTFVLLDQDGGVLKKWNGGSLKEILANI